MKRRFRPSARPPRIAITCDRETDRGRPRQVLLAAYADAVRAAGGIPLLLPEAPSRAAARRALASADGVLFSGGNDMNPLRYGQSPRLQTVLLDPVKEASDFRHLAAALGAGLPLLGICHGAQLLNVARGGTLFQDIPTQLRGALPHRPRKTGGRCLHPVHVRGGSVLRDILRRPDIVTNSAHHQAIDRIGRGLEAVAWAPDGVIEAIEDPSRPFVLGVQWHPERMTGRAARSVIRALVRAAGRGG